MVQPELHDDEEKQDDLPDDEQDNLQDDEISPEELQDGEQGELQEDNEKQDELQPTPEPAPAQPAQEVIPEWQEPMNQVNQRLAKLEENYQPREQVSRQSKQEPPKTNRQLKRERLHQRQQERRERLTH